MKIASMLVPEIEAEFAVTRRHLESAGDDLWNWQPHVRARSLGELLAHIAELPSWYKFVLGQSEFDFAQPGEAAYQPSVFECSSAMLEAYDSSVQECLRILRSMDDSGLAAQWTLFFDGQTVFSGPRFAALRSLIVSHMIHHRAQLTMYLRQTGGFVPKSYGPSADEKVVA